MNNAAPCRRQDSGDDTSTYSTAGESAVIHLVPIPTNLLGRILDHGKASAYAVHLLAIKLAHGPGFVLNEHHCRREYGMSHRAFYSGMNILKESVVLDRSQPNHRKYAKEKLATGNGNTIQIREDLLVGASDQVAFELAVNLSPQPMNPAKAAARIGVQSPPTVRKLRKAAIARGAAAVKTFSRGKILVARKGFNFDQFDLEKNGQATASGVIKNDLEKNEQAKDEQAKNGQAHSSCKEGTELGRKTQGSILNQNPTSSSQHASRVRVEEVDSDVKKATQSATASLGRQKAESGKPKNDPFNTKQPSSKQENITVAAAGDATIESIPKEQSNTLSDWSMRNDLNPPPSDLTWAEVPTLIEQDLIEVNRIVPVQKKVTLSKKDLEVLAKWERAGRRPRRCVESFRGTLCDVLSKGGDYLNSLLYVDKQLEGRELDTARYRKEAGLPPLTPAADRPHVAQPTPEQPEPEPGRPVPPTPRAASAPAQQARQTTPARAGRQATPNLGPTTQWLERQAYIANGQRVAAQRARIFPWENR